MKMNKVFALLLVLAMLLASSGILASCGNIDHPVFPEYVGSSEPENSEAPAVTVEDDTVSSDTSDSDSSDESDVSSEVQLLRITSQPKSLTVSNGGSVKISVKAKGENLKYKWYFRQDGESSYAAMKGYTHSSETVKHDGKWERMLYYCVVSDGSGNSVTSETAAITLERLMRVLAVGDSICRGGRNSHKGFVGDLGLPYLNLGQNGATLSTKQTSVPNIPQQLADVNDYKPDIIIADGGVNDYIYDVPLGTIPAKPVSDPDSFSDKSLATAMGGLQRLFALMKSKFPEAQRYFVITHRTTQRVPTKEDGKYVFTDGDRYVDWTVTKNKAGYTQQDLHDAIVSCCKVYGVEVIDVYNKSDLNTADSKYRSSISFNGDPSATESEYVDIDGVHPLDRGYRECYMPVILSHIKSARQSAEIPLEIIRQPQSRTINSGEKVTVSINATGSGLKFQWFFKKSDQTSFSEWKGRTHDSESVTPNETWDGIQLYCVVSDKNGKKLKSDVITISFVKG